MLRYKLAPGSRWHPNAYARAVAALGNASEKDLAAGVSVTPLIGLPIIAHLETRLSVRGSSIVVRPAAFVSGGVDRSFGRGDLGFRSYIQAGYVGGRDATGFVDGNAIVDKAIFSAGRAQLSAGAGAWGGAQQGAARLDIGPSASLRFRLGEGTARISADYRLRVAGNAEPAGGVAVTLSTGF